MYAYSILCFSVIFVTWWAQCSMETSWRGAHMVWLRLFMIDTGSAARLMAACEFTCRSIYIGENRPFKLGSSECVWVSVCGLWCYGTVQPNSEEERRTWLAGLRDLRDTHVPSAGQLPATFRTCVFVFGADLQLLSFPHSPRAVKWLKERSVLKFSCSVGTNYALPHTP